MNRPFEVGDRIYGFCNGYFGRDCYVDKICIVANSRYAVFEDLDNGFARILNYPSKAPKFFDMMQEWKKKKGR